MDHLLSWIIWLPVIGMGVIAFIPRDKSNLIKQIAALVSGVQLLLTIYLWSVFDASNGNLQFIERAEWIPSFNITYILGVDGLSLPMVFLMALIGFIGIFVNIKFFWVSFNFSVMSVSINPGAIQFTVIPLEATSEASDLERPMSPDFAAT